MLSRVAENLYWMARYLERAENTARLINATTQVLLDLPRGAFFGWDVLIRVAGLDSVFRARHPHADEESVVRFLILDPHNPSSVLSCIHQARENTRTFREVLPMEIWERINALHLYIREHAARATKGRGQRYQVLNGVIERRQSIIGLLAGSMSHDIAYQFLQLGRNLERADMTTRILDVNSAVRLPADPALAVPALDRLWMTTLNALSAYQMYRCHVGVHVRASEVVSFLLKDPHFPRTVHYCLNEIESSLGQLPRHQEAMQAARRTWKRLVSVPLDDQEPGELHDHLDQIQADLNAVHAAVARQYFELHQENTVEAGEDQ